MRWKALASLITVLAFLIPVAPAQAAVPGLDEACQPTERREYKDLRKLIDIDLDRATDIEVRVRANQILAEARTESLPRLPGETQKGLDGSAEDLRTFLKSGMQIVWSDDLRVLITRTSAAGGTQVRAAAGKALDGNTIEALLAYLNDGLYAARELDCRQSPSPSPSPSPAKGGLPTTGADLSVLLLGGAALVVFGIGAVVLTRRSRI